MKIKQEKQLTLPQLIEWGFENDVTRVMFSDDIVEDIIKGKRIRFEEGVLVSIDGDMNKEDTFTIEIEEEIDEDTEIDKLVVIDDDDDLLVFSNYTIREIKNNDFKEYHAYIDGEFKLIWTHEKGLVE